MGAVLATVLKEVKVLEGITPENIPQDIINSPEPVVIRQLVRDWPLVRIGLTSNAAAVDYLKSFYNGRPTIVCKSPAENNGRLFYNENFTKMNYESYKGRIDETLDAILDSSNRKDAPNYYIASNVIDTHFPGLKSENDLVVPRNKYPESAGETVSIWIGSTATASCHFDALDNLACCIIGRRRFTVFPPDQVRNLYPGPLEPTPGGQVISLVDFKNPDFEKFPRFKDALAVSCVAELEPGDALFLPSMWWHHVESLSPFNVLVNYWWTDAPRYLTSGMTALFLAMLGIRDKPRHEREGWKHLFDHYIFDGPESANAKIPPEARGFLEPLDEVSARKLRALLINKLNR